MGIHHDRYFNSSKYRAFHRTLNLWGFAAIHSGSLQGCIWHPSFKRGRLDLFQRIHRVERSASKKGRPSRAQSNPQYQLQQLLPSGDQGITEEGGGGKKAGHRNQLLTSDSEGGRSTRLVGSAAFVDITQEGSHTIVPPMDGSARALPAGAISSLLGAELTSATNSLGVPRSISDLRLLQQLLLERQLGTRLAREGPGRESVLNRDGMKLESRLLGDSVKLERISQQQLHPSISPHIQQMAADKLLQQMLTASHIDPLRQPYQGVATAQNLGFNLREQLLGANINSRLQLNPAVPGSDQFMLERLAQEQKIKSISTIQGRQQATTLLHDRQGSDRAGRFGGSTDIEETVRRRALYDTLHRGNQESQHQKAEKKHGVASQKRSPSLSPTHLVDDQKKSAGNKSSIKDDQKDTERHPRELPQRPSHAPLTESTGEVHQQNADQLLRQLLRQQSSATQSSTIPSYMDSILSPSTTGFDYKASVGRPTGDVSSDQLVPELLRARLAGMGRFGDSNMTSSAAGSNEQAGLSRFQLQQLHQHPFQQESSHDLATQLALLQSRGSISTRGKNDDLIRLMQQQDPISQASTLASTYPPSNLNQLDALLLRRGLAGIQDISDDTLTTILQSLQNPAARPKGDNDDH